MGKLTLEENQNTLVLKMSFRDFYEEFLKRIHVVPRIFMSFKYSRVNTTKLSRGLCLFYLLKHDIY